MSYYLVRSGKIVKALDVDNEVQARAEADIEECIVVRMVGGQPLNRIVFHALMPAVIAMREEEVDDVSADPKWELG